jgi:hypothetical protein
VGRSTRLPDPNHPTARDVALRAGFETVAEMQEELAEQMKAIRAAYSRILS